MAGKSRRIPGLMNHPLENTLAAVMLDVAVRSDPRKQAEINRALGFKSRSQLCHFALGIAPIPVEQAPRLAAELSMDEGAFVTAVLRQRHPEVARAAFHDPDIPDDLVAEIRAALIAGDGKVVDRYARIVRQPLSRPPMRPDIAA